MTLDITPTTAFEQLKNANSKLKHRTFYFY